MSHNETRPAERDVMSLLPPASDLATKCCMNLGLSSLWARQLQIGAVHKPARFRWTAISARLFHFSKQARTEAEL